MFQLSRKDWTGYLVELVVVVLGILIAFQVDEWRDQLAEKRELRAALSRLNEETQTNLHQCNNDVAMSARLAGSMHVVLKSLAAGRLEDSDSKKFDNGLARITFNPQPQFLSSVVDEMIATGLLKDLDDVDLRANIAELPVRIMTLRQNVLVGHDHLTTTADELNRTIEYTYTGSTDVEVIRKGAVFEQGIGVNYDFEQLTRNQYLKNLIVEATDIHTDRYRSIRDLCEIFAQIDSTLND